MADPIEKYKSSKNTKVKDFFSNLGMGHVIIIGICLVGIIAITSNENADPRYNYVAYAILIGVILVMFFKPNPEKTLLPKHIVIEAAQEEVNRMVRIGREFSYDSKVIAGPACRLNQENEGLSGSSGPISWDVGITEFVRGSQYKKEGVISIHPFKGIVMGFEWRLLGYTGRESRDRDIIPVGIVQGNMQPTDFGKDNQK